MEIVDIRLTDNRPLCGTDVELIVQVFGVYILVVLGFKPRTI